MVARRSRIAVLLAGAALLLAGCGPTAHSGPGTPASGRTAPPSRPVPAAGVRPDAIGQDPETDAAGAGATDAPGRVAEDAGDEEDDSVDDEVDTEPPPDATIAPPHPLADLAEAELERRLASEPAALGSMSIGKPNAGRLFNGVQMQDGDAWTIVAPGSAWATEETVRYLDAAVHLVTRARPGSAKLAIGDISARNGGYLSPHLSHQAGRDVDISYYYLNGQRWYQRATAANLDVDRTWALVRALVTETDVEMLLVDRSIQGLLRQRAEELREDPVWLDTLFRGRGAVPPMIRHAPGHATHLHIRFYNPIAQETGRRAYAALVRQHKIQAGMDYVVHVARKGETLAKLAKRYGTTVRAIRQANGLRSTLIQARKSYRIPRSGRVPPSIVARPVTIPPRRLPPPPSAVAESR